MSRASQNSQKIDAKCDLKNDAPKIAIKIRKIQFLQQFWLPQTWIFLSFLVFTMVLKFQLKAKQIFNPKMIGNAIRGLPKSPPELKLNGLWPVVFGRWLGSKPPQTRQWLLAGRIKRSQL